MKYYYITGTSRGIGKALAVELLKDHQNVVHGISRTKSIEHKNYVHTVLDLSDADAVAGFRFKEHQDAEKVVLVNNAGTLGEIKHLGKISNKSIKDGFTVNVIAPAILMNNFIKAYKDISAEKIIINLTSGAAQNPYDGWAIYSPSKAAIDMLSRVGALEQELEGSDSPVKIKALAPGVVETQMQQIMRNLKDKDFSRKQKFVELHTNNELYPPEEVAKAFVRIMDDPDQIDGVIHRISL